MVGTYNYRYISLARFSLHLWHSLGGARADVCLICVRSLGIRIQLPCGVVRVACARTPNC